MKTLSFPKLDTNFHVQQSYQYLHFIALVKLLSVDISHFKYYSSNQSLQ